MTLLKLQLPLGTVSNLNTYRNQHYYRANKEKLEWTATVIKALRKAGIKPTNGKPLTTSPVTVRFSFYFWDKRRRDLDGMAVIIKYTLDAFIKAKLLPDDSTSHIHTIISTVLAPKTAKQKANLKAKGKKDSSYMRVSMSETK
jgi:Holliday junction resolvase RusA-like endonuclease